jgi:hypothetical protein
MAKASSFQTTRRAGLDFATAVRADSINGTWIMAGDRNIQGSAMVAVVLDKPEKRRPIHQDGEAVQ